MEGFEESTSRKLSCLQWPALQLILQVFSPSASLIVVILLCEKYLSNPWSRIQTLVTSHHGCALTSRTKTHSPSSYCRLLHLPGWSGKSGHIEGNSGAQRIELGREMGENEMILTLVNACFLFGFISCVFAQTVWWEFKTRFANSSRLTKSVSKGRLFTPKKLVQSSSSTLIPELT